MIDTKVYGIHGEGRTLCHSCAQRLYGNSLEMYLTAGVIQKLSESDRTTYASKGLLCDDCSSWIFEPDGTEDPWWSVDPDPQEQLRYLAPFADFLEILKIDVLNMRNPADLRP